MATGIVILNYNGAEDTVECVKNILAVNSAPVKFIVVDNGSTREGGVERIDRFLSETFGDGYRRFRDGDAPERLLPANLVVSPTNDGYAAGNNKGLRFAFEDDEIRDILILNNDILFQSDILPALLSARERLERPAVLTPLIYNKTGRIEYSCARTVPTNWQVIAPFALFNRKVFRILPRIYASRMLLLQHPEYLSADSFEVGIPSGSFMLMDKALLKSVGGFREGTFLYYEENILCSLFAAKGLRNYCIPTCTALHCGGASTLRTAPAFLKRCNLESADLYLRKYTRLRPAERCVWAVTRLLWKPYLKRLEKKVDKR